MEGRTAGTAGTHQTLAVACVAQRFRRRASLRLVEPGRRARPAPGALSFGTRPGAQAAAAVFASTLPVLSKADDPHRQNAPGARPAFQSQRSSFRRMSYRGASSNRPHDTLYTA